MATVIGAATVAVWVYLLFFRGAFWWLPYRPAPIAASVGGRSVVAVIPARDEVAVVGHAVASLLALLALLTLAGKSFLEWRRPELRPAARLRPDRTGRGHP